MSAFSGIATFSFLGFHYFVSKEVGFNQRLERIVLNYALVDLHLTRHVASPLPFIKAYFIRKIAMR